MNPATQGISQHKGLLAIMTAGHFVNDFVAGALWIIAPAIAVSMGLGPSEVGLILAVYGIAAGLTYIPAGILADRVSNQGVLLLISFWWVVIGYFLATQFPGFWPITLLLALGVMGDAFWHPVATGVLVKSVPGRRAQVLGIHAMGGSAGAEMFGPLCAGFLLGYFSWQTSLQLLLIPPLLLGIGFFYLSRHIPRNTSSKITLGEFSALLGHWSSKRGLAIIVLMIAYNMSLYGMLALSPVVLQNFYGFNPWHSSLVFAGMLIVGTLGQPLLGKISDIYERKRMIGITMLLAFVSALIAGLVTEFSVFILALVISITVLTAIRPVILAAAVDFSGKSESTTLGVVFAILDGVGAMGALLAGYAGEIQLHYVFLLGAILAFLAFIVTLTTKFSFDSA